MRILLPALLAVVSCGISQGHQHHHGKRNHAKPLPEFTPVPQLPKNSSSALPPLYQPYSKNKPKFQNEALIRQLSEHPGQRLDHLDSGPGSLRKRDLPVGTCAPGVPCTNGACCSNTGVCSYAPSSCGADVCISNCDAKAPCGQYANPDNAACPLSVCCSQYGFCGSTDDFCGTGCQEGFGGCGPAPTPSCSSGSNAAARRRIGYYESWATVRPCDVFTPEDLELTGLTHINFAFSFFDPSTFQISPMDGNAATLYSRFTALKAKQPGLQTWLAVGGWSFNDATNTPNTQNAFSDMVSTPANRQAFITSLRNFMQTYGFDGVDIDWEYPAADDRGGVPADFSNFPTFLDELRASFGSGLGISATLPSSYWYLQHFDVLNMERSLDWFNVMSYDIHGVWDSTNKFTGPYIRPHTNLTEINDGLSLLWRAGVDPSKVVLGLGWYGRSFTLADPSCTTPNGVCQFTAGGNAGECTRSSGTLSNAEIKRLIAAGTGTESYDATAGVRWLTFNTNQWVSYDDGVTMQQKLAFANSLCLGGTMIWSIDQDNTAGDSMNDLMGIGTANGVSEAAAASFKEQMANATLQNAIASSCYWSLCGGTCTTGYFDVTEARGQVAGLQQNSVCAPGEFQTLCCAPGTTMGTCQWEGFRGVGMPCSPACSDSKATIVARNSNSYEMNDGGQIQDLTCTGGFQAYCCTGFVPSSITNSGNLVLYGQTPVLSKREGSNHGLSLYVRNHAVEKRAIPGLLISGLGALCLADAIPAALLAPLTFGLSLAAEGAICAVAAVAAAATAAIIGFAILLSVFGWIFSGSPSKPNAGVPTTVAGRSSYGQWPILDFSGGTTTINCDCVVTYTCRYGMGWDEICDNQRWGIDKLLNGKTVYQPLTVSRAAGANQGLWRGQRKEAYRTAAQLKLPGVTWRCQVDEFPMGNLAESGNNGPQACRLVNGPANGRQGNDYQMWKLAQWKPCSTYRAAVCNSNDGGPPATWAFGALPAGRGSGSGKRFIDAYGFDEQTANSLCWATYTYTDQLPGTIATSTPVDHGFRVLDDDPMYGNAYGWPRQSWRMDPAPVANYLDRPGDSQPAIFQRDLLANDTSPEKHSDPAGVCHADLRSLGNGNQDAYLDLDYDNLLFVDIDGKPVDGRTCNVIYEDDGPHSELRIILDEEGNVVDMYMGDPEAGSWTREAVKSSNSDTVTVDPTTVTVTTGVAAGSESRPTFPASTIGLQPGSGS